MKTSTLYSEPQMGWGRKEDSRALTDTRAWIEVLLRIERSKRDKGGVVAQHV